MENKNKVCLAVCFRMSNRNRTCLEKKQLTLLFLFLAIVSRAEIVLAIDGSICTRSGTESEVC